MGVPNNTRNPHHENEGQSTQSKNRSIQESHDQKDEALAAKISSDISKDSNEDPAVLPSTMSVGSDTNDLAPTLTSSEVLVRGKVQKDRRTKRLALRTTAEDIAVIHHLDLDRTSAQALADTGVRAVINAAQSVSGYYPNHGPQVLLDRTIPVVDSAGDQIFDQLSETSEVVIANDGRVFCQGRLIGQGTLLTQEMIDQQNECAQRELDQRLDSFARNTLTYLETERNILTADTWVPATTVTMEGRHVLVVVRGANYQEDLNSLHGYIREMNPVLVAVDGGADALIEMGWTPDIIIGDMDSVTDDALRSGAQLIAHVYASKPSPALDRIDHLGLVATPWSIKATSEDLALLLAYHSGADLIVAVGTHVSLVDYLDKGRGGMASTFLVRLKVGNRLVDAKGVSKLYRSSPAFTHIAALCVAAICVIATIFFITPALRHSIGLAIQLLFH